MSTLVCPQCESAASLYSLEEAMVAYPVKIDSDGTLTYTGDDSIVYDEGTSSADRFECRSCMWQGTQAELLDPDTGKPVGKIDARAVIMQLHSDIVDRVYARAQELEVPDRELDIVQWLLAELRAIAYGEERPK